MSRFATILAVAAMLFAAPAFADLNHMDLGGSLDTYYIWIQNTFDFNSDGLSDYYGPGSGDDQDDFLRMNARLWFEADLSDDVMVHIGLEADRDYQTVDIGDFNRGGSESLDVFVEEAYVQFSQIYDSAWTFTMGRKYLNFGDDPNSEEAYNTYWGHGFILSDAISTSPQDLAQIGTIDRDPFDMILATGDFNDWLLNIGYDKAAETRSIDEDADAWFVYLSYLGLETAQIDGYFTFNMVDGDGFLGANDLRVDQYIVGLRVAGDFNDSFAYKGEIAYNFGDLDGTNNVLATNDSEGDISGWAAQLGVHFHPDADYNPGLGFMYTFLSGDEDLAEQADFDGFFAPFEGKVYGEIADVYVKTNMHVFNLYGGLDLTDSVRLSSALYYFLLHDEDEATILPGQYSTIGPVSPVTFTDDDGLGWEWDVMLDYMFSEEVSAQLAAGIFFPGDAIEGSYTGFQNALGQKIGELNADDEAVFFRGAVKVKF
ncbi:alginate export family protein [bacterium]|nr:alginate export family protein [bacterium]